MVAGRPQPIILVSCVGGKKARPSPARDLYLSPWFHKARTYAEARQSPWFILSAKYGLLAPAKVIAPYNKTLNKMRVADRRLWAERVMGQLRPHLRGRRRVVILAGRRYAEFLTPRLEGLDLRVDLPLARLRIGEQLQWLARRVDRGGR